MDEELYRLVSTGLLAFIALLLIVTAARLGRIRKKLESSPSGTVEQPSPEPVAVPQETATAEPDAAATPTEAIPAPAPEAARDEGPFEKDGRWWYRRDDELLVYDERTEQWVEPELHPLEDARGWDAGPVGSSPVSAAAPAPSQVEAAPEPAVEEPASATPGSAASGPVTTAREPVSPAPIPEPVAAPAPITDGADEAAAAHWKCPACGVINGSTAISCRMCFTARP